MAGRVGCTVAVAVGVALVGGCTGNHGKTDPAAPRAPAVVAPSPTPSPTKEYSPVGAWMPTFLSPSIYMVLFTVESNGEVTTLGEPLRQTKTQGKEFVLCSGKLSSMSMPAEVKLSCLDTAELKRTLPPEGLKMREYAGVVDVGPALPSLEKFGEDMLTIRWSNGQVDLLFKDPNGVR